MAEKEPQRDNKGEAIEARAIEQKKLQEQGKHIADLVWKAYSGNYDQLKIILDNKNSTDGLILPYTDVYDVDEVPIGYDYGHIVHEARWVLLNKLKEHDVINSPQEEALEARRQARASTSNSAPPQGNPQRRKKICKAC